MLKTLFDTWLIMLELVNAMCCQMYPGRRGREADRESCDLSQQRKPSRDSRIYVDKGNEWFAKEHGDLSTKRAAMPHQYFVQMPLYDPQKRGGGRLCILQKLIELPIAVQGEEGVVLLIFNTYLHLLFMIYTIRICFWRVTKVAALK